MKTLKEILPKNDGEIMGQKPKQPLRKTAEEWKKLLYKGLAKRKQGSCNVGPLSWDKILYT